MSGRKFNFNEGVVYRKTKLLPFKKVIEHLFDLYLKYQEKGNDLMVDLIKLCMNSLYGQPTRKDINEEYIKRSENWLVKNND